MAESLIAEHLCNVRRYGATGDGETKDTPAITAALRACADAGGGTVYFPAGNYVTGSIDLDSHMTLYLDAGATILGSTDRNDYPLADHRFEGRTREIAKPLIGGSNLSNVAIKGEGIIDGQGGTWWRAFQEWHDKVGEYESAGLGNLTPSQKRDYDEAIAGRRRGRPRLIELTECERVVIQGVTLQNSPSWTLHPVFCENVTIDNVLVRNPPESPNTDGINPDSCRYVRITNCHLDVGDDCITIKSGLDEEGRRIGRACEQIAISNCTMVHGHGGVVIGSEMSGGVRDVAVSNCVFSGTDTGIRMKTKRGRGGIVENVSFSNIVMNDVGIALLVDMHYACGGIMPPEPVSVRTPVFRHIAMSNIRVRNARTAGSLTGLPEMPFEDLSLSNVRIAAGEGIVCKAGKRVQLQDVHVDAAQGPCLICEDVEDLGVLDSFAGRRPRGPAMTLSRVRGAFVRCGHGDEEAPGGPLVQLQGDSNTDIRVCASSSKPGPPDG